MKKLVYLINDLRIGGAEKGMVRIVNNLPEWDITVIALKKGDGEIMGELNVPVEIINLDLFKLYKLLKRINPDILWCSLWHSTIIGRVIGKLAGIPVIINWEHSENMHGWHRILLNRLTMHLSKLILADTEKVAKAVRKILKANYVQVIPIAGINVADYNIPVDYKIKESYIVGSLGTLRKAKGYEYLASAAKIVHKKYPQTKFVIGGDGPEKNKLEGKNIVLAGFQNNIPNFLTNLDIYVQPSLWEGMCIAVIEAMAAGLPTIASNVGGIPEAIDEILIPPKNSLLLAEKIIYLIEHPDIRERIGLKNRKTAQEKYSLHITINKIQCLLKSCIS